MVEKATAKDIVKADIDVCGLLTISQTHNANQLSDFCMHFLYTNYKLMKRRPEWENLNDDNKKYLKDHQWPPKDYWKQVKEYEAAMAKFTSEKGSCNVM